MSEYKELNKEDINTKIETIVDELQRQSDSRESVNSIVKGLKEEYGLSPTVIRSTSRILHQHNQQEIEEKNEQVQALLSLCR